MYSTQKECKPSFAPSCFLKFDAESLLAFAGFDTSVVTFCDR